MYQPDPGDIREKLEGLTNRQRAVLWLICEGKSYKEIGGELGITVNGVKSLVQNIYIRLNLKQFSDAERFKLLHEVYCRGLRGELDPEPELPAPNADTSIVPYVPKEIVAMVDEDEPSRPPIVIEYTSPTARRAFPWAVLVTVLSIVGLTYYATRQLTPAIIQLATQLVPQTQIVRETQIIQQTVVITSPPGTPRVVVVTATPKPPTPLPTATPVNVLFQDDFNNDIRPDWIKEGGDWKTSNGQLINAGASSILWLGKRDWKNYTVEFDLVGRFCYAGGSVLVRMQDTFSYVEASVLGCNSEGLYLFRKGQPASLMVYTGGANGHVKITVENTKYTKALNGSFAGEATDGSYSSGSVGFVLFGEVSIDNLKIVALP